MLEHLLGLESILLSDVLNLFSVEFFENNFRNLVVTPHKGDGLSEIVDRVRRQVTLDYFFKCVGFVFKILSKYLISSYEVYRCHVC